MLRARRRAGLRRIAGKLHVLDIVDTPVPTAARLEAVLRGLREVHADDNELTVAAAILAELHAALGAPA